MTWTAPDANGATITGYEAQYRKKVADGETPNAWTTYTYDRRNDNSQTSAAGDELRPFNLPDLTAGATYEVQVRAPHQLGGRRPLVGHRLRHGPTGRRTLMRSSVTAT